MFSYRVLQNKYYKIGYDKVTGKLTKPIERNSSFFNMLYWVLSIMYIGFYLYALCYESESIFNAAYNFSIVNWIFLFLNIKGLPFGLDFSSEFSKESPEETKILQEILLSEKKYTKTSMICNRGLRIFFVTYTLIALAFDYMNFEEVAMVLSWMGLYIIMIYYPVYLSMLLFLNVFREDLIEDIAQKYETSLEYGEFTKEYIRKRVEHNYKIPIIVSLVILLIIIIILFNL